MPTTLRLASLLPAVLLVFAVPGRARAGNEDELFVGNDAAMAAGAVVAIVSDGSAVYYNPAGLAGVNTDRLDVSASAFILRIYRFPTVIESSTGASADGNLVEFGSAPSALSYVRPINDRTRIGFGVFVPRSRNFTIATRLAYANEANPTRTDEWLVTQSVVWPTYYFAAGVGWAPNPHFRIGASILILYESISLRLQFAGGVRDPMGLSTEFLSVSSLLSGSFIGVALSTGFQADLGERFRLGFYAQIPAMQFFQSTSEAGFDNSHIEGMMGSAGSFSSTDDSDTGLHVDPMTPARLRLGLAYVWDRGWASVEGELLPPLRNGFLPRELTWNVRAGARAMVADHAAIGGGFFTDRKGPEDPILGTSLDFYGVTLGIELSTDHMLAPEEEHDRLTFRTTIALRYAYGFGDILSLGVVPLTSPGAVAAVDFVDFRDASVHELALHLGSTLTF